MIFEAPAVPDQDFERVTGWRVEPEGLCRDARCVPFVPATPGSVELAAAARALGMPLVHDEAHGLWALGAQAGGRALQSAVAPDLRLRDASGDWFALSSLRGRKVLLVAWASW